LDYIIEAEKEDTMNKRNGIILLLIMLISGLMADFLPPKNHLTAGSEPDYPPYCLVNENGEAEGFSIDLFRAAANAVNLSCEFRIDLWQNVKNDLAEGRLDALPMVGRTPEREPYFDFTFPYISLHGAVFVRKNDDSITSLSDLKGKEIALMKGDNAEEYVRRESITDPEKIIAAKTFQEAFYLLDSGKHDAVITQRVMGLQLLNDLKINSVKVLDFQLPGFRQDFCFAVQEGNKELLAKLNEGLAIIISDGTYDKIHQKWFSPVIYYSLTFWQKAKTVIFIVLPVILVIFLVMLLFSRKEVKRKTADLKQEIAERKIINQKLEESESKFRSYVDNAPTGIFVTDDKGCYIDVNKAACQITGYSKKELIGKNLLEMVHPEYLDKANASFQTVTSKGFTSDEVAYIRKDGETRFWRVDASKLTENTYLGFTVDITKEKQAELELQQNKDQLQHLFDNMNSGFAYHKMIFDDAGNPLDYIFLDINLAFEELLNIKKEDYIGKRVSEVLPGTKDDPADWIGKYGRIAQTGKAEKFEEFSQDVDKWFAISAYSPRKGYFATVFDDITSRKLAEEELNRYKENLEELVKERTAELQKSNLELERFNKLFIGREFRIKELRDKIAKLEEERET
jgi:PAS domain S-box-containing protein